MNISKEVMKLNRPFKIGDHVIITEVLESKDEDLLGKYATVVRIDKKSNCEFCGNDNLEICNKSSKDFCILVSPFTQDSHHRIWTCYARIIHKK